MNEPHLSCPPADRDDTVEILHGTSVPDPYRYLEDPDADRTRAFVAAQNAVSEPYLAQLAARGHFLAVTTELLTAAHAGTPWERGGRYFRVANPGDLDQDQLLTGDTLDELLTAPRVLLDPNTLSADGTTALTAARVSPDGTLLAYALSDAGSDWRTVGVRDVATGADLPDRLSWTKWVDPTWLPGGTAFLSWRYPAPDASGGDGAGRADRADSAEATGDGLSTDALTEAMGAGELALHRLGTRPLEDEVIWTPAERDWMVDPWVSPDGTLLVLTASPGTDSRSTVQVRRIPADGGPLGPAVTVVGELADAHTVVHAETGPAGAVLYLRTERDAPRGRLVAVDPDAPDAPWRELVAQHPSDVLVDVDAAADAFLLVWSRDAAHHLEIRSRDGVPRSAVTLAGDLGPVSVTAVNTRASSTEVFLGVTSFTREGTAHRLDLTTGQVQELPGPAGRRTPQLPAIRSERVHAASADGTPVPMTLLARADLPDGPRPTLLYGYGGFDVPILPSFSALFTAWVAAGGVLAVANLRGGGEFGAQWHEAGMGVHKQRVFDDVIGCAEHLIATGVTTAGKLAVHGRSNGGLLVGAAITQRPELFAAALPTVGVMDMLRFHRFTIGWAWTSEYGDPDDPEMFPALLAYSPLHRLVPGTNYPPTLINTGDHDDRVVPAHSLKFGAEMQRCQAGPGPVILRIDTRAGHGMGKPARARAAEYADQLAFAAEHTGLQPAAGS